MFYVKLCLVALACTNTGICQGNSDNSSVTAMTPSDTRRMSEQQAASLRRQLMEDNYDYSHSEDRRKNPNISAKLENTANVFYQKGTHYVPASEVAKSNSDKYSQEHDQNEQSGQHKQDDQHEPPDQDTQRGQYEPRSQYEHQGQREQYGQEKQINQYTTPKKPIQAWSGHDQLGQQGQFNGQGQEQYEEPTDRARPSYVDADELTVRDVIDPRYTLDRRDIDLARRHIEPQHSRDMAHNPAYHKQRDTYNSYRGEEQQARPFSDLRGDFKEQYEQNGAVGQPGPQDQAENEDYNPEDQAAIDQQKMSDSQDDGRSDYSQSKKQSRELYNEFGHTNRAKRLQYYTRTPAARAPADRGHYSLNYQDPHEQPGRNHLAPPARNHYTPTGRNHYVPPSHNQFTRPGRNHHAPSGRNHYAPPQSDRKPPLDHNISKKDLLYYMDDTQMRRHNNEMSPDVPDEEELPSLIPSNGSRVTPSNPQAHFVTTKTQNLLNTERAHKSFVVTVSPGNVTYKLLTLKTREGGRRHGERRILEERGPEGVAIISLDHAPLPAFRLPRSRRQYMNNHRHGHHQKSA